ncbi:hypothetical protein UFOVP1573_35 [uncultured Caudovirales phage]|uniref:Uncharacterized protein n=1 Tax=uncultured Caudovirales phage TaxID=2100421 RepID=A0A6J5SLP9_9CAUD|nr:hypothetical protein UFOVP1126_24 [uncultured Caudovirales phage]CAB4215470.1 hypothetical protein UFOVP1485_24 [uncultured Caudovirales phage]CAB5230556.1 hypothetical protein UFOVP1573_35 [uncultured Caudovirales phage]
MQYAFISADGKLVNIIEGALSPTEKIRFLADYRVLYGAEQIVEVEAEQRPAIGGTYTDGVFTAPPDQEPVPEPQPEPLPEIMEPEI